MLSLSAPPFPWQRSVLLSLVAVVLQACGGDTPTQVPTPVPTTIALSATTVSLSALGATAQLSASVLDENGSVMSGAAVVWASSDGTVATVSATGLVTAVDNGTAVINATSGALTATAVVAVTQLPASVEVAPNSLTLGGPGATATVLASVLDAEGQRIEDATLAWISDDDAVASVDGRGRVTAVAAGTANISVEGAANGGTASQALPVLVNASLQIETTSLPDGDKLLPYGPERLAAVGGGGGYVWSVAGGDLPAGLAVAQEGLVSGTPTAVETAVFTIQVVSGDGQVAQRAMTLTIDPPPVLLPTDLCSQHPANAVATFEDTNLEMAVRSALGLTAEDDLVCTLASSLKDLDASSLGIMSAVGIQNLTGLVTLNLSANAVSDLSPLSTLTGLAELSSAGNGASDLSPLSTLTSLLHLQMGSNGITDLGPLAPLTGLTRLVLGENAISDLSPLAGMTELAILDIWSNDLSDIGILEGLMGLDSLDLRSNAALGDIQPLIDNPGLESGDVVRLDGTMATCVAVSALAARGPEVRSDCVFLQPDQLCTDFGGAAIPDFEDAALESAVRDALGLSTEEDLTCALASSLTDLDASSLGITSAVGIQNLTGLATLNLFANAVSDLSPLSTLTGLTELSAASNGASDLSPLSTLTNLVHLQMGSNGITDLSPLAPLTGLTRLVLGVNAISDLSPLAGMTGLAILDIWNNDLSDLSVLEGLLGLNFLDLRSNAAVSDIQPLIDNPGLTTGDTVWLQNVSDSMPCAAVTALQAKGVAVSFNVCS